MSVLRDAKELGYGLDHFIVTGENFPPEWEDDNNEPSNFAHEYDDDSKNIYAYDDDSENVHSNLGFIDTSIDETYIDEHIHKYVRRYNPLDDYITDPIDNNYIIDNYNFAPCYIAKQAKRIVNAAGKTVVNEMLDITEYVKNIDIKEARRQGIIIKSIRYQSHPLKRGDTLKNNIEKWTEDEDVLLDKRSWGVKYSERERNKRKTIGRASHLVIEKTFSNFRMRTKTGYSSSDYYLMFGELNEDDYTKYKKHPRYNPQGTPTMIQIAFGLMKKYKELEVEIRGYIPGINEPSGYER